MQQSTKHHARNAPGHVWCNDVTCSVAEVFDLFDDVLLLAEGHIVFHGPKDEVQLRCAPGT